MNYSMELVERLIKDEGVRYKLYRDSEKKLTIGIGHNIQDKGLRPDEIALIFKNDVEEAVQETIKAWPWVADLDPVRRDVVLNMSFNMGVPTLSEFKRTLASIERGDYELAADEMLESLWARQVGARAIRLSQMMRYGVR